MTDKSSRTMNHVKHIPKDAQVIMSIMKDMGITEYEPKVINQLLEFTYRYVTCILDDSKVYANHAKKKFIDLEDVRLAVKMQLERTFTNPPPRDVLLDVARAKNNIPLPFVKPNNGLRLPPDRYCLAGTNYKLKNSTKKVVGKAMHSLVGNNISAGQPRVKVEGNKSNMSIVKRPGTLATIARTQTISIPKPVVKFTSDPLKLIYPRSNLSSSSDPDKPICRILCNLNPRTKYRSTGTGTVKAQVTKPKIQITANQTMPPVKMEIDDSAKRKREDDDYDVP